MVYKWCRSRTDINPDDEDCAEVMRRFRMNSKRETVKLTLRSLAAGPMGLEEARRLRGSGWEGTPDEMRDSRTT